MKLKFLKNTVAGGIIQKKDSVHEIGDELADTLIEAELAEETRGQPTLAQVKAGLMKKTKAELLAIAEDGRNEGFAIHVAENATNEQIVDAILAAHEKGKGQG